VRRSVHFQQGNVLAPAFLPGNDLYDIIFCRNLLIYFERGMQQRAVGVLTRLLADNGALFITPSEASLWVHPRLAPAKVRGARLLHKTDASDAATSVPAAPARIPFTGSATVRAAPPRVPANKPRTTRTRPAAPGGTDDTAAPQVKQHEADLAEAGALANQGRFDEAAALCTRSMQVQGPSAQGLYLLGLVHDAKGERDRASDQYRKALYLDPTHHEALMHLAYALDAQGDSAGARVMRQRAGRAAGSKPETR
jgi:chemotaxis protein methyltransferase WspC